MFIKAYLRASTTEQDANRAKDTLDAFVSRFDKRIAAYYIENKSGNSLNRPELTRLFNESESGDVLLVESIDRLTRLSPGDWETLVTLINEKGISIVSLDLPTSHLTFGSFPSDDFMNSILKAINNMLLEILAASSYKEYQERERKQKQGIIKAQQAGLYNGRQPDLESHKKIAHFTKLKLSINETAEATGVSRSTVIRVRRKLNSLN
jgi:DNA invertase Pin-like site-specific DNA recombinase